MMFTCLYIKVVLGVVAACARALHSYTRGDVGTPHLSSLA